MFSAGKRFTGLLLTYQLSAMVGGYIPLIDTWLVELDGSKPWLVEESLAAVSALSFLCAALARPNGTPQRASCAEEAGMAPVKL